MSGIWGWLAPIRGHITGQTDAPAALPTIRALRFAHCWAEPRPGTLWVGTPDELRGLFEGAQGLGGMAFFCAGGREELVALAQRRRATLVTTDLDLIALFDVLSSVLWRHQEWSFQLLEAAGARHSIQDVVNTGARLARGTLFLMSAELRVLYAGGGACLDSAYAKEILDQGHLSKHSAHELLGGQQDELSQGATLCRDVEKGGCCWVRQILQSQCSVAYALLFVPNSQRELDAPDLLDRIGETIHRVASFSKGSDGAGAEFRVLLADLLSGHLSDEGEIRRRCALLPLIPKEFCTFVIIESYAPRGLPAVPAAMLDQLETIFPGSNAAVYDDGIVLLLSSPDRNYQPTPIFDRDRLGELLLRYDSYAAISNATSRRAMMRTNYILTKSVLHLGRSLCRTSKERMFFFEDYAEYVMIDLCINSFSALLGHDDIIYLTHPAAVKLYRHDLQRGTNLMEVLYYYCLNNLNISQSAKVAYMHRNTFSARLAKALELLGAETDLANGEIQQRMIFSYKILRYYDRYAKVNLEKRLSIPGADV